MANVFALEIVTPDKTFYNGNKINTLPYKMYY